MATVASILIKIGADSSALRRELQATKKQLNETLGSEAMGASKTVLAGIGGMATALGALGVKAVQAAGGFQQTERAMTNMLGSQEKAQSMLQDLQDFAAKTPFEFNDVAAASQKFLAFGFTAEQIIPTLTAVGDAAAGVGLGKEGIDRITLALGQMGAKARVQSDEMLQLTEAGIPAWQMLADKIGTSVPEAMDRVSKGMVDSQTGLQALVGGMEEKFGGMMNSQATTITGTWSNMMDGLSQTAIVVGQQISDALNLPGLFSSIGDSLQEFSSLAKEQGIAEALSQMIPPEVQAAAAALAVVLTTATIPAIVDLGISAQATAVSLTGPLLTSLSNLKTAFMTMPTGTAIFSAGLASTKTNAAALGTSILGLGSKLRSFVSLLPTIVARLGTLALAAGPVGIAIAAVGAAIAYFIESGHSLTDLLNVMPGTMDAVNMAGTALKRLWGEIGVAIKNLISAASPLIEILAVALTAAIYVVIAALNVIIAVLSMVIAVVVNMVTAFIAAVNWLYDRVASVLSQVGNAFSEMADSILPAWASNGLKTIGSFVQTAMGWLQKLIDKVFQTNNALSNAGNTMTDEEKSRRKAAQEVHDSLSSGNDMSSGTPDYSQFATNVSGDDASGGKSGKGSKGKENDYDPRAGAIYNAQRLTGLSYGTAENQVVCTTYVENAWSGAGLTNAFDLGGDARNWAQNAGSSFHTADSGYVGKPGDAVLTIDSAGEVGHAIMIDENGTGYYAAGGWKGESAHYDQDYRDAFAGKIYGYINMAEYGGFQDKEKMAPTFNWDQSVYTQAIKAAAQAYNLDPKLLLAVAMRETGGDTVSGITMSGGNGGGMMQILSGDQDVLGNDGQRYTIASMYGNYQTDVYQNAMAGAAMLQDKIKANGGDTWAGVADYYGGADKGDYANQVKANYQKVGGDGGQLIEKQMQEYKQMLEQAQSTSQQIDDTYAQSTMTQEQLVDRKFQKEYAKLEESKAFNANYAKDKAKLDEMYSQEKLKAIEADATKMQEIQQKAMDLASSHQTTIAPLSMTASQQELAKMAADHDAAIASIQKKWQQYSSDYAAMTANQRAVFLKTLDEQGIDYEKAENGELSFHQAMLDEKAAADKAYYDQRLQYLQQAKDIEADLEQAKNEQNMTLLMDTLTAENAQRLNDYEAQKSMMETYQETYLAAHATTAQMVANLYSTAFSGLSTALTDMIMGTKTLQQAFTTLGRSMIQVIVEFYAKQLAGMLVNSAMAKSQTASATAQTAAQGASMAASLGPAAFFKLILDPAAAGVALGLMTSGTAASSAMGLGGAFSGIGLGSSWSQKQSEYASAPWNGPKLATGGITKGATIAMIGEGRHDEAVLPLSRSKFEQLGLIDTKPATQNNVTMQVSAIDSSSFMDFLNNGGGLDKIKQALFENDRNFATESGVW